MPKLFHWEGGFGGRCIGTSLFASLDPFSVFLCLLCTLRHPSSQFPYTLALGWIQPTEGPAVLGEWGVGEKTGQPLFRGSNSHWFH